MEQLLNQLWQTWQYNGASPQAQPLVHRPGWTLTLCFRARVTAWILFLMFVGGFVGVLILQAHDPMPQRKFMVLLVGYSVIASLGCYYLGFVYWYRVTVDEAGIELRRLLVWTKHIAWQDVVRFDYQSGNETMRIHSADGRKLGLYLSLHGLSAVRRCLAVLVPRSESLEESWIDPDTLLMQDVPSWRCSDQETEGDPFAPLQMR